MAAIFIVSFLSALLISSLCSVMEAVLYSVPLAYVNHLASEGKKTGILLKKYKENISKPVAGILILNTLAHTVGASISGWAVGEMYGQNILLVFSIIFTLLILYISEIIPKMIGVVYCKQLAPFLAYPLKFILVSMHPLVVVSEILSSRIKSNNDKPLLSSSEIVSMSEIGEEEGALDALEGSIIRNIIGLDELLIKDVLTPRVVVFRLDRETIISNLRDEVNSWNYTRVPVYSEENPDILTGYVTQRDIYRVLLEDDKTTKLKDIARPIKTIPELMHVDELLLQFFERREHICAVVDEHGSLAGIITLEDILEEVVGKEIVDEYDAIKDLRKFARVTGKRKLKGKE